LIKLHAVRQGKAYGRLLLVLSVMALLALTSRPQAQEQSNVEIKKVPAHPTTMVDGAQLYQNHCATCHGAAGKGDGPAARALKIAPADLTRLAKNNQGKFPDLSIIQILENGSGLAAHGSKDMPIWGPIFRSMGPAAGGAQVGHLREVNLANFLKSIQAK